MLRHLSSDEFEDALERLDQIEKASSPRQKFQINLMRLSIQMASQTFPEAALTIKSLATSEPAEPEILLQIGNQIAEAGGTPDAFPVCIIEAGLMAVERAANHLPENADAKELLERLRRLNSRVAAPK